MEISLKKDKVTGCPYLHNSDFADLFCGEPGALSQAKHKLRRVITTACKRFSKSHWELHGNTGDRLATAALNLEIK